MPTLTIEAIRENPWIILADPLPANPSPLLLKLAYLAASYCRSSEYFLMMEAREGDYVPEGWSATESSPDAHEESEAMCIGAEERLQTISELYERNYGVRLDL